ncbi:autoinducer binding domain-containing protein [Rhizobium sp. CC-YZS058]|uniref:autoinducer binding domain-containing protein n=1 Tax=Rhizobium sp. CC-YZS058 TaxID=3042153 RepID=UPI002B053E30|nr:autoinducer binding domain-containing protein [Rhizobium sp. CC-YZS058]MEA3535772.1 autoinducer binding domain-containing protein [Rhizobium sp. CC-YZS058]
MGIGLNEAAIRPLAEDVIGTDLGTEQRIHAAFQRVCSVFGFKAFLVMSVPPRSARRFAEHVIMSNWPDAIISDYDAAGMLIDSPVVEHLHKSTLPFTFDVETEMRRRRSPRSLLVGTLFKQRSMPRGVYVPVHDNVGRCGAVALSGDRPVVDQRELAMITYAAVTLFDRLSEVRNKAPRSAASLSRREIECLHWAAAGKTTVEMAQILQLSEYTVNHYLNRATRKLDSVNRVQTVAKAIRAGLIG